MGLTDCLDAVLIWSALSWWRGVSHWLGNCPLCWAIASFLQQLNPGALAGQCGPVFLGGEAWNAPLCHAGPVSSGVMWQHRPPRDCPRFTGQFPAGRLQSSAFCSHPYRRCSLSRNKCFLIGLVWEMLHSGQFSGTWLFCVGVVGYQCSLGFCCVVVAHSQLWVTSVLWGFVVWLWRIHSCGLPVFFGVLLCGCGAFTVVGYQCSLGFCCVVVVQPQFCCCMLFVPVGCLWDLMVLFVCLCFGGWMGGGGGGGVRRGKIASSFLREDLYFYIYLCNW